MDIKTILTAVAPAARIERDMRAPLVKIFGERNTGTNALKRIIEQNSAARCLPANAIDLAPAASRRAWKSFTNRTRERRFDAVFAGRSPLESWKHCATDFSDASVFAGVLVLFTVRHPASWVLSFFKRPYHQLGWRPYHQLGWRGRNLEEFIRTPWKTVEREYLDCATLRPLQLYQRKLESYLGLGDRLERLGIPYRFVRFEDLVLHQGEVFAGIAPSLLHPTRNFRELTESTKDKSKTLEDYQRYYGEEKWRHETREFYDLINGDIDWSYFRDFGYTPLESSSSESTV